MLETKDIVDKFSSLKAYEKFHLDWASACAKLNPTEDNVERYRVQKHRAELMGVEV